jgi:hypothetical protein
MINQHLQGQTEGRLQLYMSNLKGDQQLGDEGCRLVAAARWSRLQDLAMCKQL